VCMDSFLRPKSSFEDYPTPKVAKPAKLPWPAPAAYLPRPLLASPVLAPIPDHTGPDGGVVSAVSEGRPIGLTSEHQSQNDRRLFSCSSGQPTTWCPAITPDHDTVLASAPLPPSSRRGGSRPVTMVLPARSRSRGAEAVPGSRPRRTPKGIE